MICNYLIVYKKMESFGKSLIASRNCILFENSIAGKLINYVHRRIILIIFLHSIVQDVGFFEQHEQNTHLNGIINNDIKTSLQQGRGWGWE